MFVKFEVIFLEGLYYMSQFPNMNLISFTKHTQLFVKICPLSADEHKEKKHVVLVFSQLGISRSATVIIAYLMHHHKWTLQVRISFVSTISNYQYSDIKKENHVRAHLVSFY